MKDHYISGAKTFEVLKTSLKIFLENDIYSVFAFIALPRYSVFSLIISYLSYISCPSFNRELLYQLLKILKL